MLALSRSHSWCIRPLWGYDRRRNGGDGALDCSCLGLLFLFRAVQCTGLDNLFSSRARRHTCLGLLFSFRLRFTDLLLLSFTYRLLWGHEYPNISFHALIRSISTRLCQCSRYIRTLRCQLGARRQYTVNMRHTSLDTTTGRRARKPIPATEAVVPAGRSLEVLHAVELRRERLGLLANLGRRQQIGIRSAHRGDPLEERGVELGVAHDLAALARVAHVLDAQAVARLDLLGVGREAPLADRGFVHVVARSELHMLNARVLARHFDDLHALLVREAPPVALLAHSILALDLILQRVSCVCVGFKQTKTGKMVTISCSTRWICLSRVFVLKSQFVLFISLIPSKLMWVLLAEGSRFDDGPFWWDSHVHLGRVSAL